MYMKRNFVGNVFEQISHIIVDDCSIESLLVLLLFVPINVLTEAVNASGLGITPGSVFVEFISSTTSWGGLPSNDDLDCCCSILSSIVSDLVNGIDDDKLHWISVQYHVL